MEYVTKRLTDALAVTGIVNLHFFKFQPDFTTSEERHPFYELVFVNSGELTIRSEDYTGTLSKNEMLIHRCDTLHSLASSKASPEVIIIGFECNSKEINRFSCAPTLLRDSHVRKLGEIVKEGRNVFMPPYDVPVYNMKKKRRQRFGAEQMLRMSIEYFLIRVIRETAHADVSDDSTDSPAAINEIVAYMNDNFLEKITIDELAFLFKTNRATLCKRFKAATGRTLIEFINEKKLEAAKAKIINTNDTFTKIAEDLNFESIHYFTRFFKKMSGITPKEFRKNSSASSS